MLYWGQLLHFYQPPTQTYAVLARIADESYRPLLTVFEEHPAVQVTFNINGVLLDLFHEHGMDDIVERLSALVQRGQVELTGTGKFHPLLPLLPADEMERQLRLDAETKRRYFGDAIELRGCFPPELAFDRSVVAPVVRTGHEWVLLSGVANPVSWPTRRVDRIAPGAEAREGPPLAVLYRDDILSNRISFRSVDATGFVHDLDSRVPANRDLDAYVVTGMDAETYGHHIKDWERVFLAAVYARLAPAVPVGGGVAHAEPRVRTGAASIAVQDHGPRILTAQLSRIVAAFPPGETVEPRAASWSTSEDEIRQGNPFPLWATPGNPIHAAQWELLQLAIDLVHRAQELADSEPSREEAVRARALLDRAEHSCQWWWASRRPMWSVPMIERGLLLQWETIISAYHAVDLSHADPIVKRNLYERVMLARTLRDHIEANFYTTD